MIKKQAIILSLFFSCLFPLQLAAQKAAAKADNNGLLFEISGKGLAKPSYIFGTFHILCPTDMLPMDKFAPYVSGVDQMVMEIDMDDPAEVGSMAAGAAMSDGKTIKDLLTAEQYTKVDEMFKNTIGVSVDRVNMLKPSILSVVVITNPKMFGCSPSSYELSFVKLASEGKKPIYGLETVAFQSKVLDVSLEKQAESLVEMTKNPQKSVDELKKVIQVYKEQDVDKLRAAAVDQDSSDAEFNKKVIDERNASWLPKIEAFIKDKPTFIAVGAGHLGGDSGVIRLLRARGYNVKPIRL